MKYTLLCALSAMLIASCGLKKARQENSTAGTSVELVNPVLPGDNPDPSIIRVGNTYYATSTTNEWAPYFTIYKSANLKDWKLVNHVFPEGFSDMKNQWGENNFWASELAYDARQNRIYAYYTAHNRKVSGNPGLQCGVAWIDADKIETGKFTDNGPVIIEDDCGAIDAFEFQDNGKIYVFWKNDGNGCGKESWIWVQEIDESRTKLLGQKRKVYTNSQPWENALVEGASFFRMGEYVYSMYAVGGCCDAKCNYKTGIARTKDIASGVWEKYEKNPIMVSNEKWRCPGHGTVMETADGRFFMMYHAFNTQYDVFVGREGILEELKVGEDGWPVLHNATVANRDKRDLDFSDHFAAKNKLSLEWQWPSKLTRPEMTFHKGLHLAASENNRNLGTFIGQFIKTTDFSASVKVNISDAHAGVVLGGAIFKSKWPGELGAIGISVSKAGFRVFTTYDGKYEVIKQGEEQVQQSEADLKIEISNKATQLDFYYKLPKQDWQKFHSQAFDAAKYVPWGMGYRVGITAKGDATTSGVFKQFELKNH